MKPRLQTSLGQQLVLTPQLRQALHLLQLSSLELESEITLAVESNPLLDWAETDSDPTESAPEGMPEQVPAPDATSADESAEREHGNDDDGWEPPDSWNTSSSGSGRSLFHMPPPSQLIVPLNPRVYSTTSALKTHPRWVFGPVWVNSGRS